MKKVFKARKHRELQGDTLSLFLNTLATLKRKATVDDFVSKIQIKRPALRRVRILSSLNHLKKESYIDIEKKKYPTISFKGQVALRMLQQKPKQHWDHRFRFIVLDKTHVPQTKIASLRKELCRYGFLLVSRGVYVYPYPCEAFIELLHMQYKCKKRLVYFVAQDNESLAAIKKQFALR